MMPLPKPGATSASGVTIEALMNAGDLPARTLSRFGPTWPAAPASASVWQEPHAVAPAALPLLKSAFASTAAVWPEPAAPPAPPPAPPAPPAAPAGLETLRIQVLK